LLGGSGNAISCSLLYQHHESFQDEVTVAALNVAVGKTAPVDYLGKSRLAPLPPPMRVISAFIAKNRAV
jgi:hypothetical protein